MKALIIIMSFIFSNHLFAAEKIGEMMTKKGVLIPIYNSMYLTSDLCKYYNEEGKSQVIDPFKLKWLIANDSVFCFLPISQKWGKTELLKVIIVSDKYVLACSYDHQHYIISMNGDVLEEELFLRRTEPIQKMLTYFPECPELKEKVEAKAKEKLFPEFILSYELCNTTIEKRAFIDHFEKVLTDKKGK
jgi:hypothetical protein